MLPVGEFDRDPFSEHSARGCELLTDALVDQLGDSCAWKFHDETGILVVDEREELPVDPRASSAHDRPFDRAGVFDAQFVDKVPEQLLARKRGFGCHGWVG